MAVTLNEALRGKYNFEIRKTDLGEGKGAVYEAWYPTIRGCIVQAPTKEEAIRKLETRREGFLRKLDSLGAKIPLPDWIEVSGPSSETFAIPTGHVIETFRSEPESESVTADSVDSESHRYARA